MDFLGDFRVKAVAVAGFKRFLHASVFPGMKGQDGHASAGFEAKRKVAEEAVEGGKLIIHGDAQGLKNPAHGELDGFASLMRQQGADGVGQFAGGGDVATGEGVGESAGEGFVGVLDEQFGEILGGEAGQPGARGLAALWVHAHVERAIFFEGEAAFRIVNLHGGDPEVGEDEVHAFREALLGEGFGEAGEVAAHGLKRFGAVTEGAQAGFGAGEFEGVGIEADEASAGLEAGEDFLGVAAIAEGAIGGELAGVGGEKLKDFGDHDGAVGAGGGFAGGDDLGDGGGVGGGAVLFIFVLEAAGIFAGVTGASPVRNGVGGG